MGGTLQRLCSRELAVPLTGVGGGVGTGTAFASLCWSSFNNLITNNLKLCFFTFFVDLSWLKSRRVNAGSYTIPSAVKQLKKHLRFAPTLTSSRQFSGQISNETRACELAFYPAIPPRN